MDRSLSQTRSLLALSLALALAIGLSCGASVPAHAQRGVIVNGQWRSPAQIEDLERAHCGFIPNGNYLLDFSTGAWSAPGEALQPNNIADNCRLSHAHSDSAAAARSE